MEISFALMSLSFGLFLAALAVAPNLIGIYRKSHARERHLLKQNASLVAYPTPVPFNYPEMVSRTTTEK